MKYVKNIFSTQSKYKKNIIIIVMILLFSSIVIYTTYVITYQKMYDKANIQSEDFIGTYRIINSSFEYITIKTDDTYLIYNAEKNSRKEGECEKTDNNYTTLYGENNIVIATIVYLNGKYYLIRNAEKIIILNKESDSPITG